MLRLMKPTYTVHIDGRGLTNRFDQVALHPQTGIFSRAHGHEQVALCRAKCEEPLVIIVSRQFKEHACVHHAWRHGLVSVDPTMPLASMGL